jgi:hypothetical protein
VLALLAAPAWSWLKEFPAKRSASYRRKRFEVWTKALEQYELDFADGRRFMGRIVYRAMWATIWLVLFLASIFFAQTARLIHDVGCEFHGNCEDLPFIAALSQVKMVSGIFMVCGFIPMGIFDYVGGALRDEVDPEKYRSRAKKMLSRYGDPPRDSSHSVNGPIFRL